MRATEIIATKPKKNRNEFKTIFKFGMKMRRKKRKKNRNRNDGKLGRKKNTTVKKTVQIIQILIN